MKHSFCISFWLMTAWLLPCTLVSAQTPFDAFSPETSRIILDRDSIAAWRAEQQSQLSHYRPTHSHPDTILCALIADLRNEQLLLVDIATHRTVAAAPFTDEIKNWLSVDPLVDKNITTSPYLYCNGNPIMFIDPDGRDDYRYDIKTGDFILMEKTDTNYDRVGKYRYDRKTGEYIPRLDKNGAHKYYGGEDGKIAKGILRDGLNFKNKVSYVAVDAGNRPASEDVYQFALFVDKYLIGREMVGCLYRGEEKGKIALMPYEGNTSVKAFANPLKLIGYELETFFHTHGQAVDYIQATTPSPNDIKSVQTLLKYFPQGFNCIIIHSYGAPIQYQ